MNGGLIHHGRGWRLILNRAPFPSLASSSSSSSSRRHGPSCSMVLTGMLGQRPRTGTIRAVRVLLCLALIHIHAAHAAHAVCAAKTASQPTTLAPVLEQALPQIAPVQCSGVRGRQLLCVVGAVVSQVSCVLPRVVVSVFCLCSIFVELFVRSSVAGKELVTTTGTCTRSTRDWMVQLRTLVRTNNRSIALSSGNLVERGVCL